MHCVEKFMEHIQDTIKRLYLTFPLQPMTKITTAVVKRGYEAAGVRSI